MNLLERFAAAWAVLTASAFDAAEGKPELTEENVAALEDAAAKLDALTAENNQLKEENQLHAEVIEQMETETEAANASAAVILEALQANNVEVPEGTDITAVAVEKINAWGKTVPAATAVVPTDADNLGDSTEPDYLTAFDKREIERRNRNKK